MQEIPAILSPSFQEYPVMLESDLIHQAKYGDKSAYGELVRLYHTPVINVVYRMCGDAALAEDAAQIAFLKAWQSMPGFRPSDPVRESDSFRNWLFRIAINAAMDMLRRKKPQVDLEKVELVDPGAGVEAGLENRERIEAVRQAVLGLPDASRAVLILREYEDLSYREISAALDIPLGTVMSRLNYARNTLAQRLSGLLED